MAMADTAHLAVEMSFSDRASRGMDALGRRFKSLNLQAATLRGGLSKIGRGLETGIKRGALLAGAALGFLALTVKQGIDALAEEEKVANQTNAVLKSTRGVAGLTGKAIADLAAKYSDLVAIEDEEIQQGENVLLTFTNIRKKAFEPATKAALDMAAATGRDLTSAFRLVGRALNDPVKGLTALTRLGVQFTDTEKKKIEALVKSGNLFEAQRIVLGKLNRLYGGSAAANARGYAGAQRRLSIAIERVKKSLAGPLIGPLTKLTGAIAAKLSSAPVQAALKGFGQTLASFISDANIQKGIDAAQGLFTYLRDLPWGAIGAGLSIAGKAAQQAVSAFTSLPPEVQGGLITLLAANKLTGGLVASGLGELIKFGLSKVTSMVVTAAQVTVVGAAASPGGTPTGPVPVPGQMPSSGLGWGRILPLLGFTLGGAGGETRGTLTPEQRDAIKRKSQENLDNTINTILGIVMPKITRTPNAPNPWNVQPVRQITAIPSSSTMPGFPGGPPVASPSVPSAFGQRLLEIYSQSNRTQTTALQFQQRQADLIAAGNETTASKWESQLAALQAQKDALVSRMDALNATSAGTLAAVKNQPAPVVNVSTDVMVSASVTAGAIDTVVTAYRHVGSSVGPGVW